MNQSKKLIFFGNERLATGVSASNTPVLQSLIDEGYDITAIVANFETPSSRSARGLEIAQTAKNHNLPLLTPGRLLDIKPKLMACNAEAGVLVAYGKIIPAEIIDLFPRGIINLHPSLLPKYRGPTPLESVILDGAGQTGVSLMQLSPKMDAGGLFAQATVGLSGSETKQELADKLLLLGRDLLIEHLDSILEDTTPPSPQDDLQATYCKLINKVDGKLNWADSAQKIEREVRAYAGWPKSQAEVFGQQVIITKSRVAKDESDGALVQKCGKGWLEITQLIAPSGREVSGADFILGYRKK